MVPRVSIITPSFNRAHVFSQTLDSVLAQTHEAWELVIVDDGSTDDTEALVATYAARDPRIRFHRRSREPKGACTCRNEGVGFARGEYLLFLDTDDLLEPFCLEQRVRAMDAQPALDFAIFPSLMFENEPHDLRTWWNVDKPQTELVRQFRQDAIAQGTGVMWRKDAFERIGMWDAELRIWQDIDLFFRAYISGSRYAKFFDLPPDLHNRTNHASLSRANFFEPAKLASRVAVIRRAVDLLKEHGRLDQLPEARFMVAETVIGAARAGEAGLAMGFWRWATVCGVLNLADGARLLASCLLHVLRAHRFNAVAQLIEILESPMRCTSTLGKVPYEVLKPARHL